MTDIRLDTTLDLIEDSDTLDWVEGDSRLTNQDLLLITEKGEWKGNPGVGVGAQRYLENESTADFTREVRRQYSADGMVVRSVTYENGKLKTDANYPG